MDLSSFVTYNKDTGRITTIDKNRPKERVRFFKSSRCHYKSIFVNGKDYLSHRLIFLLVNGHLPKTHVDHINGNGLDNRWVNIREVTQAENNLNKKVYRCNSTGVSGVTIRDGRYRVRIRYKGILYNVGTYKTLEEARKAREVKEIEFGFHKNHGKR
ncbi:MAG: HNH endonuclease [Robiginitomaculum sp.]|nr:HNH endonuclease [Robiginitomaculum sp.]